MKTKIKLISAVIFFILGFGIFVYPRITDRLYKEDVYRKEREYIKYIEDVDYKNIDIVDANKENIPGTSNVSNNIDNIYYRFDELYNLLESRNNELYKDGQRDFIYNTNYIYNDINLSNYGIKYNIFGYLELPSIGITLPIYLGASNSNMKLGAVHLTGTSYPIGGINTNSVIAAHRGYHRTKMFRDIDKIKIGDIMYIKNFMGTLKYQAVRMDIISSNGINDLTIEENRDMITIISCHPYPFNYQRYVVYFARV